MRTPMSSWKWRFIGLGTALTLATQVLGAPAGGPASTETPEAVYEQGVALQRSGQHVRSIPYFEAVARAIPNETEVQLALGMAYYNASIQTTLGPEAVRYVVATSQERARLRGLALGAIRRAGSVARTPAESARALGVEARVLELIGAPAEAREALEKALSFTPDDPLLQRSRVRVNGALCPRAHFGASRPVARMNAN